MTTADAPTPTSPGPAQGGDRQGCVMADDNNDRFLGRTRWLDPDSQIVTDALNRYHCDQQAWREPWRTKHGENDERFRMALALEDALPAMVTAKDQADYDKYTSYVRGNNGHR